MAKVSAKSSAKKLRKVGSATFIQRSRSVPSEEKAVNHHLGKRPFFGLSGAEGVTIQNGIEKLLQARLNASGAA
jgi:hypothetical protein